MCKEVINQVDVKLARLEQILAVILILIYLWNCLHEIYLICAFIFLILWIIARILGAFCSNIFTRRVTTANVIDEALQTLWAPDMINCELANNENTKVPDDFSKLSKDDVKDRFQKVSRFYHSDSGKYRNEAVDYDANKVKDAKEHLMKEKENPSEAAGEVEELEDTPIVKKIKARFVVHATLMGLSCFSSTIYVIIWYMNYFENGAYAFLLWAALFAIELSFHEVNWTMCRNVAVGMVPSLVLVWPVGIWNDPSRFLLLPLIILPVLVLLLLAVYKCLKCVSKDALSGTTFAKATLHTIWDFLFPFKPPEIVEEAVTGVRSRSRNRRNDADYRLTDRANLDDTREGQKNDTGTDSVPKKKRKFPQSFTCYLIRECFKLGVINILKAIILSFLVSFLLYYCFKVVTYIEKHKPHMYYFKNYHIDHSEEYAQRAFQGFATILLIFLTLNYSTILNYSLCKRCKSLMFKKENKKITTGEVKPKKQKSFKTKNNNNEEKSGRESDDELKDGSDDHYINSDGTYAEGIGDSEAREESDREESGGINNNDSNNEIAKFYKKNGRENKSVFQSLYNMCKHIENTNKRSRIKEGLYDGHSVWGKFIEVLQKVDAIDKQCSQNDKLINLALLSKRKDKKDQLGDTPLFYAIRQNPIVIRGGEGIYRHVTLIDELFKHGANPNLCNVTYKVPPLLYALLMGRKTDALLEMLPTDLKEVVIEKFPTYVETEIFKYLLSQGANPRITFHGINIQEYVHASGNLEAMYFLKRALQLPKINLRRKQKNETLGLQLLPSLQYVTVGHSIAATKIARRVIAKFQSWHDEEMKGQAADKNPLIIILTGMPGSGKSNMARQLGHALSSGDPTRTFNIQFKTSTTKDDIWGVGAKWCGGNSQGSKFVQFLTKCNSGNKHWKDKVNVAIIDEFEKAMISDRGANDRQSKPMRDILSQFYDMLEEGMLSNVAAQGQAIQVSIRYTIFVFCGNFGQHDILKECKGDDFLSDSRKKNKKAFESMKKTLKKNLSMEFTRMNNDAFTSRFVKPSCLCPYGKFIEKEVAAIIDTILRKYNDECKKNISFHRSVVEYGKSEYAKSPSSGYRVFKQFRNKLKIAINEYVEELEDEEMVQNEDDVIHVWYSTEEEELKANLKLPDDRAENYNTTESKETDEEPDDL